MVFQRDVRSRPGHVFQHFVDQRVLPKYTKRDNVTVSDRYMQADWERVHNAV